MSGLRPQGKPTRKLHSVRLAPPLVSDCGSFEVEVEELPSAFYVDVYYESPPGDYFALIASEWFKLWE